MLLPLARHLAVASLALVAISITVVSTASAQVRGIHSPPPIESLKATLQVSDLKLVHLPIPDGIPDELGLVIDIEGAPAAIVASRKTVRAVGFRVLVEDSSGLHDVEPPPARTYRGSLLESGGLDDGSVAASLLPDGIHAIIRRANGDTYGLVPAAPHLPGLPPSVHALYRTSDNLPDGSTCGVVKPSTLPPAASGPQKALAGLGITQIAYDADVEFYQKNSSSVSQTVNDIESIQNGVQTIYENDVSITYAITAIIVRTTNPDPYDTSDSSGMLSEFRVHWNASHGDIQRDVAHLMTGKNLDGSTIGVALLSVICQINSAYGLSQSRYTSNYTNRVALTAHELGHNWGSGHCSGGSCYIMCPSIGGCGGPITQFGSFAQSAILSYKNNAGCISDDAAPLPLPFADSFATASIEPANWATVSGAQTSTSGSNEPTPPYSLNLDSNGGGQDEITSSVLALSGAAGAALSYSAQHVGVENGESLVVEGLDAGATWFELDRITSDGSNQTSFAQRILVLPAASLHNAFQLRFRAEGNAGNDDWFVDDVLIGPPPLVAPSITLVTPATGEALTGAPLSVSGTGFNAPDLQVTVGGVALLPIYEYTVLDAWTLEITPPTAAALGPTDLVVSSSKGTTPPYSIPIGLTDPPRIVVAPLAFNFQFFNIAYGGQPGQMAFLLANLDGAVLPFQGNTLLDFLVFIPIPGTNGAGTGAIQAQLLGLPPNITLHTQVLFIPPPGNDPSQAKPTNIGTTFIPI